jgi:hypothetical protein
VYVLLRLLLGGGGGGGDLHLVPAGLRGGGGGRDRGIPERTARGGAVSALTGQVGVGFIETRSGAGRRISLDSFWGSLPL